MISSRDIRRAQRLLEECTWAELTRSGDAVVLRFADGHEVLARELVKALEDRGTAVRSGRVIRPAWPLFGRVLPPESRNAMAAGGRKTHTFWAQFASK